MAGGDGKGGGKEERVGRRGGKQGIDRGWEVKGRKEGKERVKYRSPPRSISNPSSDIAIRSDESSSAERINFHISI